MRHVVTVLLSLCLIGCSGMDGETERKVRVQALINRLADESLEDRQATYAELRDTFVRKRDIPELTKRITRNANPEVTKSLRNLITFIKGRWRLPDKGWTTDNSECHRRYQREFDDLGCGLAIVERRDVMVREGGKTVVKRLRILDIDVKGVPIANRTGVTDLILTLEPESLIVWGYWADITCLGTLANLEDLRLLSSEVTDLTPLKGMPRLRLLDLRDTKVTDLTPLEGLPNLTLLDLENTRVADLTPLKGLPKLHSLYLKNTRVTDLTPLKGLRGLSYLDLQNTGVTDLTPVKGMPHLRVIGK